MAKSDSAASNRRASAVRALLERQGVPADLIQVQSVSDTEPSEVEVRMTFAGVARASAAPMAQPAAQTAPAPTTPPDAPAQPEMAPQPEAAQPETTAPDTGMQETPEEEVTTPPDT